MSQFADFSWKYIKTEKEWGKWLICYLLLHHTLWHHSTKHHLSAHVNTINDKCSFFFLYIGRIMFNVSHICNLSHVPLSSQVIVFADYLLASFDCVVPIVESIVLLIVRQQQRQWIDCVFGIYCLTSNNISTFQAFWIFDRVNENFTFQIGFVACWYYGLRCWMSLVVYQSY